MKSGVYTITNLINGKMYVGCSKNLNTRYSGHLASLRKNKHGNIHLQRAYNKYGEENLEYEVLEYCEEEFLFSTEMYWINMLGVISKEYGYNIKFPNPYHSGTFSKDTRLLISKLARQRGVNINQYDIEGNFIKKWESAVEIEEILNFNSERILKTTLSEINYAFGFRWIRSNNSLVDLEEVSSKNLYFERKIYQFTKDKVLIKEWSTIEEIVKHYGMSTNSLKECIRGRQNTSVGFIWSYTKDISKINFNFKKIEVGKIIRISSSLIEGCSKVKRIRVYVKEILEDRILIMLIKNKQELYIKKENVGKRKNI